jgi:hypothetical protein
LFYENFNDVKIIDEYDQWEIRGNKNPWKKLSGHMPLIIELN